MNGLVALRMTMSLTCLTLMQMPLYDQCMANLRTCCHHARAHSSYQTRLLFVLKYSLVCSKDNVPCQALSCAHSADSFDL